MPPHRRRRRCAILASFALSALLYEERRLYAHAKPVNWTIPHRDPRIAYFPRDGWVTLAAGYGDETFKSSAAENATATVLFRGQTLYYTTPLFFYEAIIAISLDGRTPTLWNVTQPDRSILGVPPGSAPISNTTFLIASGLGSADHRLIVRRGGDSSANVTFGQFIYTVDADSSVNTNTDSPISSSPSNSNRKLIIPLAVVGSLLVALIIGLLFVWAIKFPHLCCVPARRIIWKVLPPPRPQRDDEGTIDLTGGDFDNKDPLTLASPSSVSAPQSKRQWMLQLPKLELRGWLSKVAPGRGSHSRDGGGTTRGLAPQPSSQTAPNFEMSPYTVGLDTKGKGIAKSNNSNNSHQAIGGVAMGTLAGSSSGLASPTTRQLALDLPYIQYLDALTLRASVYDDGKKHEHRDVSPLDHAHLAALNTQNSISSRSKSNINLSRKNTDEKVSDQSTVKVPKEKKGKKGEALESQGGKEKWGTIPEIGRTPTTSMQVTVSGNVDADSWGQRTSTLVGESPSKYKGATGLWTSDFGDGMVVHNQRQLDKSQLPPIPPPSSMFKISRKALPQMSANQGSGTGQTVTQMMGPRSSSSSRTNSAQPSPSAQVQTHSRKPDSQSTAGHSTSESGPLTSDSGHGLLHGGAKSASQTTTLRPLPAIASRPVAILPSGGLQDHEGGNGTVDAGNMSDTAVAASSGAGRRPLPLPPSAPSPSPPSTPSAQAQYQTHPTQASKETRMLPVAQQTREGRARAASTSRNVTSPPNPPPLHPPPKPPIHAGQSVPATLPPPIALPPLPHIAATLPPRSPSPPLVYIPPPPPPLPLPHVAATLPSRSPSPPLVYIPPPPPRVPPHPPHPPPSPPPAQIVQQSQQSHPPVASSSYSYDEDGEDSIYADYEGTWPPASTAQATPSSVGTMQSQQATVTSSVKHVLPPTRPLNIVPSLSKTAPPSATQPLNSQNPSSNSNPPSNPPLTSHPPVSIASIPTRPNPPIRMTSTSSTASNTSSSSRKHSYDPIWRPDAFGPRSTRERGDSVNGGSRDRSDDGIARYTTGRGVPQAGSSFVRVGGSTASASKR